jgi:hypothetical protein
VQRLGSADLGEQAGAAQLVGAPAEYSERMASKMWRCAGL